MRYDGKQVSFDVPSDWTDCSICSFSPDMSAVLPNVTMTREPALGPTLRAHADAYFIRLAQQLEGLEVIDSLELVTGGRTAIEYRVRYPSTLGTIEQRVALIDGSVDEEGKVTTFKLSMLAHERAVEAELLHVLDTVVFPRDADPFPRTFAPSDIAPRVR